MRIKIDFEKTRDSGDMGTKADYACTVVAANGRKFEFDFDEHKDFLKQPYEVLFEKIELCDEDAFLVVAEALVDDQDFVVNDVALSREAVAEIFRGSIQEARSL